MIISLQGDGDEKFAFGSLPAVLPGGRSYRVNVLNPGKSQATDPAWIALAWALASYKFNRYKKVSAPPLHLPGTRASALPDQIHVYTVLAEGDDCEGPVGVFLQHYAQ